MTSKCDNCDWSGELPDDALTEVKDLADRLEPGREVPSGECPECGCLCYLATPGEEVAKIAKPVNGSDKV